MRGCSTRLRIGRLDSVVLGRRLHRSVRVLLSRLVHRLRLRIGLLHRSGLTVTLRCVLWIAHALRGSGLSGL